MPSGSSGRGRPAAGRVVLITAVLAALVLALGGHGAGAEDPAPDGGEAVATTAVPTTAVPTTAAPTTTAPTTIAPTTTVTVPVAPAPGSEAAAVEGDPPASVLAVTVEPSTIRRGRTATITATLTNSPPDLTRPAVVNLTESGKVTIGRITLTGPVGGTLTGRLRIEAQDSLWIWARLVDPENYVYDWEDRSAFLDVIDGLRATVGFTVTPSVPTAGGFAVVEARVTSNGSGPEGGAPPPVPSGQVSVRSGTTVIGSSQLNGQGQAVIPVIVPLSGGPLSVSYEGDDLFVGGSSATSVNPAQPPGPPPIVPPVVDPVSGEVTEESVAAPTTVPPTTTIPEDEDDDLDDEAPDGVDDGDDPADEGEVAAATGSDSPTTAERTGLVRAIPTPDSVDWSPAQVGVNVFLTLLLLILVAVPATMIDNTIEENYDRIFGSHPRARALLERAEVGLTRLPDGVLLVGISVVAALILGQLEFDLGWNLTSLVLLASLALVVGLIIGVHDLARLPFLQKAVGGQAGRLGLYPFALFLAVVLVVISKVAGFQPGFVFGVLGGLAVSDAVDETDDGRTLAGATVALLVIAFVAWLAWIPVVDDVLAPDPGLWTVFLDAFLATLWLTALTSVVFGLAPLRFFDGEVVRKWNGKVWLGLWALATFLLVQVYLHPSSGRWGGVDSNTMRSALSVFGVFFVVGVAVWAWFRFRPDPRAGSPDEQDAALTG